MKIKELLPLIVSLSGCGSQEIDPSLGMGDPSPLLQTDSTGYTLEFDDPGWRTTVGFNYRAESDTVYVVNCNGAILMTLQKLGPEGWTDAWHAEGTQCLSPPIAVLPGEEFQGEAHIWGAELGTQSHNNFRVPEIEGEYRLLWNQPVHHYMAGSGMFGDTIPREKRVSNRFSIERGAADR